MTEGQSTPALQTGDLVVQARCSPDDIARLTPGAGLGRILRVDHMQATLTHIAGRATGDVVLAIGPQQTIAGYVLLDRPEPTVWQGQRFHERWEQCEALWVLGSIEVSEGYRSRGVAVRLLEAAFAEGRYDERIVVAEGIRWHWDLEGTGLTALAYQRRLVALFARFGFQEFPTDEHEVRSDPANVLIARIGERAAQEHVRHFHALRFVSRRTATDPNAPGVPSDTNRVTDSPTSIQKG